METVPPSPATPPSPSTADDGRPRMFVDDPDADLILRSCDLQEFLVIKLYLIKCSPVLDKQIQAISYPSQPAISTGAQSLHPVLQLPDNGAILSTLLTFIFPMPTVLPPTLQETMELLSVAQKYEMASVLSHIRGCIALKDPPLISPENAFHAYSLAQKYGLRHEAVQAARLTLTFTLTIENLAGKIDVMPGAYLYGLWKYHDSVKENIKSNIQEFIRSCTENTLVDLKFTCLSRRGIPRWLDDYLSSMITSPSSFNIIEFHKNLALHIIGKSASWFVPAVKACASCSNIPNENIHTLWTALTDFVNGNIAKAELTLSISESEWGSSTPDQTHPPAAVPPLPEYLYSCKADIIIQSSDLVNFPVHKSILAFSSQFFRTMFSLPQPPTDIVSGLPMLPMSEDAEIVRALLTAIYPIPAEIPVAYDRVISLLVASQKYDMPAVQSFIRTEIRLRVPAAQTADEVFRAYAIASKNGLSPETSTTAYLTLDHPLTFESLGSDLCLFEGLALRNLVRYHMSRRSDVISCLQSFLDIRVGPSKIWAGCPDASNPSSLAGASGPSIPSWLKGHITFEILLLRNGLQNKIMKPSSLRRTYLASLRNHATGNEAINGCDFCLRVHTRQGEEYISELERKLLGARNKVVSRIWSLRMS